MEPWLISGYSVLTWLNFYEVAGCVMCSVCLSVEATLNRGLEAAIPAECAEMICECAPTHAV